MNPKKAHENQGALARSVLSGPTVALSEVGASEKAENGEGQIGCQFCKYLLEGALLGDCRVLRWIGSGAFGDVYEAQQLPPVNRHVAIKVMSIERVVDGESAEMFAREVSTIAALDHPHILPVLRAGIIEDGRSYLVMKYAAQGSLQQFCQPAGPVVSFLPTIPPADLLETPGDSLVIATAETQEIVDFINEGQADAHGENAADPDFIATQETTRPLAKLNLNPPAIDPAHNGTNGTAPTEDSTNNAQPADAENTSGAGNGTNGVTPAPDKVNGSH
ncbi:MAG: protein kinase, partial [Ktedonobacteraceae bacterium]